MAAFPARYASSRRLVQPVPRLFVLVAISSCILAVHGVCSILLLASSTESQGAPESPSSSASKPTAFVRRRLKMVMAQQADPKRGKPHKSIAQQWSDFWNSEYPEELMALQAVRQQASLLKLQRSQRDQEPPDTAGLDIALAETLLQLGQQTKLASVQDWLRDQVTTAVFQVLDALQHPPDCASARKLVCVLNKACGFGCQVHHLVHCLTHAVALNRTLIVQADLWRYSPDGSGQKTWEELMAPISSCSMQHLQSRNSRDLANLQLSDMHERDLEVLLDIVDQTSTPLEPPAMPPDVLQVMQLVNSQPEHWWVGVLSSYLLRPSAQSLQRHADFQREHSWASPIVGVHIRRTDKISSGEAKLHSIQEYMSHVEHYCNWQLGLWQRHKLQGLSLSGSDIAGGMTGICSIYLATDEPLLAAEIRRTFKHINVITNPTALATGAVHQRNSKNGAKGIYDDLLLLASTDFLVGTFSSQVSRLAFELAQVNGTSTDPSMHYHSVDSLWYYGGMKSFEFCVTHDYSAGGAIIAEAGQHLHCSGIPHFDQGLMQCKLLTSNSDSRYIQVPPAIAGRCSSFLTHSYRHVLPEYMRNTSRHAGQPRIEEVPTVAVSR